MGAPYHVKNHGDDWGMVQMALFYPHKKGINHYENHYEPLLATIIATVTIAISHYYSDY